MATIGIIEGFFGPEWPWENRVHICTTLKSYGGDFYIYAPKRDSFLRKNWKENHPADQWKKLKELSQLCRQSGVKFGVGLSPFEIHNEWNESSKKYLGNKLLKLQELELDFLGLFFDDMRGAPDLAEKQIEIVGFVQAASKAKILFCPTYYSDDPILDKVFGERPSGYLEEIGEQLSPTVEILWTGNKVIPSTITGNDLEKVSRVLRRKPFVWDNYYANDGPKQCQFLKTKPFEGRSPEALNESSGWALNLMNQPNLSEVLFAGAASSLRGDDTPKNLFKSSFQQIAGPDVSRMVEEYEEDFLNVGLDKMSAKAKADLAAKVNIQSRFEKDISDWLNGRYIVGPECLTD